MSTRSQNQTHSAKVGSSAKSKGASLPTPLDCGDAENAVKGQDERQQRAPLTAFPAPMRPSAFLGLTQAVVIDKATAKLGEFLEDRFSRSF